MKYLCCHHQRQVAGDAFIADQLWRNSMSAGTIASESGDWARARVLFGSAFEISVIRRHAFSRAEQSYCPEQLADTGRAFVTALCHLDIIDEAEHILLYIHQSLLEDIAKTPKTYDELKHQLGLVDEFLKRATGLLKMRNKSAYAETINLLSQKVTHQYKRKIMH